MDLGPQAVYEDVKKLQGIWRNFRSGGEVNRCLTSSAHPSEYEAKHVPIIFLKVQRKDPAGLVGSSGQLRDIQAVHII